MFLCPDQVRCGHWLNLANGIWVGFITCHSQVETLRASTWLSGTPATVTNPDLDGAGPSVWGLGKAPSRSVSHITWENLKLFIADREEYLQFFRYWEVFFTADLSSPSYVIHLNCYLLEVFTKLTNSFHSLNILTDVHRHRTRRSIQLLSTPRGPIYPPIGLCAS